MSRRLQICRDATGAGAAAGPAARVQGPQTRRTLLPRASLCAVAVGGGTGAARSSARTPRPGISTPRRTPGNHERKRLTGRASSHESRPFRYLHQRSLHFDACAVEGARGRGGDVGRNRWQKSVRVRSSFRPKNK